MGYALKQYKNGFIQRFDKDGIIPYFTISDFEGLNYKENKFTNSIGIEIAYFVYFYQNYQKDKYIIFCPGIGPGHTAYLREIEKLAKNGYLVLTLDYTGCDKSGGETLLSVNEPTRDVHDLIELVKSGKDDFLAPFSSKEIIVIGHSLGGYTALNTINIHPDIKKAVIISGFIDVILEMKGLSHIPFSFLFSDIKRFEKKTNNEYAKIKNLKYLKNTNDDILFIHSIDDQLVPYKTSTALIYKKNRKENLQFLIVDNKSHNPNYTLDALKYIKETFGTLNKLSSDGTLKTLEDKQNFMKDKDIFKMTEQDEEVFSKILEFLNK